MDTDNYVLKVAEDQVVTVRVVNKTLDASWEGSWKDWDELAKSSEVEHLTKGANDMSGRASKGTGKGKKGGGMNTQ